MNSPDPTVVTLNGADAEELAEMLEFLDDWLKSNYKPAWRALNNFTGYGYDIDDFRGDLARFICLLGGPAHQSIINGDDDDLD